MTRQDPMQPENFSMWAAFRAGGQAANILMLKELVDQWLQMAAQKTAGQRGGKDLSWDNMERVKMGILCEAVSLVLSGKLDGLEASEPIRTEKNTPLMLEELREMDREPVWVEPIDSKYCKAGWGIVHLCPPPEIAGPQIIYILGGVSEFKQTIPYPKQKRNQLYGKTWLAYRRKPKEYPHDQ